MPSKGFTAEERAAMKDYAAERRAAARRGPKASAEEGEADLLAKVAEMPEPDRSMAKRLHELIRSTAPDLVPRTYYGMPAYARDGSVLCWFQPASKFKVRYATLGFSDKAALDDGAIWPVAYALQELTPAVEKTVTKLVTTALKAR